MVRVRFGKREAFLRSHDDEVTVCNSEGRSIQSWGTASFLSTDDALCWLAQCWKIPPFRLYDTNDPEDFTPVFPEERILADIKTVGELTLREEIDWIMFNRRKLVYNVCDDRLWVVDSKRRYSDELRGLKEVEGITTVPCHSVALKEAWSVPEFPDQHYRTFEAKLRKEWEGVSITYRDQAGHFKVAQPERNAFWACYTAVEISWDSTLKMHRITKLMSTPVWVLKARTGNGEGIGRIRRVTEVCQKESWESLFPKEWDVVMVERKLFFNHTFAGHCCERENFVGLEKIPSGYIIAWENRYNDMLLMRFGKNDTVRCPPEYKGKIIGTGGGNIKRIAQLLGKNHWQVRLV